MIVIDLTHKRANVTSPSAYTRRHICANERHGKVHALAIALAQFSVRRVAIDNLITMTRR